MVVGTVYTKILSCLFVDIDTHLQSSNYSKKYYYYHKRDIIEILAFSFWGLCCSQNMFLALTIHIFSSIFEKQTQTILPKVTKGNAR